MQAFHHPCTCFETNQRGSFTSTKNIIIRIDKDFKRYDILKRQDRKQQQEQQQGNIKGIKGLGRLCDSNNLANRS
ncbi:hypothetical protein CHS0354_003532, partial [Potamilus streckersoni]